MSRTPFTDAIESRIILTEDGSILDTEDAKRVLAMMRKLETWAYGGPCNLDGVIKALRNGCGDEHLQGRLLDATLFPNRQEIK